MRLTHGSMSFLLITSPKSTMPDIMRKGASAVFAEMRAACATLEPSMHNAGKILHPLHARFVLFRPITGPSALKVASGALPLGQSMSADFRLEETLRALDIPPTLGNLGPWVRHLPCARDGPAAEVLADLLELPQVLPCTICSQSSSVQHAARPALNYFRQCLGNGAGLCRAADGVWRRVPRAHSTQAPSRKHRR